jgi:hypothetical protein
MDQQTITGARIGILNQKSVLVIVGKMLIFGANDGRNTV